MSELEQASADLAVRFTALRERLALETSDPDRSGLEEWIIGRLVDMFDAESADEINAIAEDSGLTASKTLAGRTFEIQDFALTESADAFREKSYLKKYAVIKAVDTSTGEQLVIDGGGDLFVAQLVAMRDRYGFPFQGTIVARPTGSGYEMLHWRMTAPKRK